MKRHFYMKATKTPLQGLKMVGVKRNKMQFELDMTKETGYVLYIT